MHLENGSLQGTHTVDSLIVAGVDAVESETQAAHIQLAIREVLDTCRIANMAQDLMVEGSLQLSASLIEEFKLMGREIIETIVIASHEVREDRTRDDGILMLQLTDKLLHIVFRIEAHAMHTGIELDVNRESGDTLLLCSLDERIEQSERIHLRLQVVIEHGLEGSHFRVHDHDVAGDTVLAKGDPLIGNSHSQIIYTMILQGLGNLYRSGTIAICLDHTDQFGFRLHEGTVVVEVGNHRIQVDLEGGFMHLLHQQFGKLIETKLAGTLQEDDLITEGSKDLAIDKLLHIREEELF